MEVCSFCRVSIRPSKNNGDFLTTMVAVGCDVELMQGESSHFMAFHRDFPISPFVPAPGQFEFSHQIHLVKVYGMKSNSNDLCLTVSQIVIFLIDML